MADHEFFGTVSVSDAPTATDQVARQLEVTNAIATAQARAGHTGTQSADTIVASATKDVFLLTERNKLTGIAAGATANSTDAQLRDRSTHTGTQSADTIVDGTTNKAYTSTEKTKLAGIASGATANSTDAALRDRSTHTGTQSADTIADSSTKSMFLLTERSKLSGIAAGATANSADSYLLTRANHTGTQTASTISDFNSAVDARVQNIVGAAPAALDTLVELANALGNDANFATTITGQISAVASRVTALEQSTQMAATAKANIGNGTASSFTINHSFNTLDVDIIVRRISDGQEVFPVNRAASATSVVIDFGSFVPATNSFRVAIRPL